MKLNRERAQERLLELIQEIAEIQGKIIHEEHDMRDLSQEMQNRFDEVFWIRYALAPTPSIWSYLKRRLQALISRRPGNSLGNRDSSGTEVTVHLF